jgi:hypothetical protein
VAPSIGRPGARFALSVCCLLAVAAFFSVAARFAFSATGRDRDLVERERYGVEMLHPLTTLLSQLVSAQSAAVRGEQVDAAGVRQAVSAVAQEDTRYGTVLGTHQRLSDLTARIESTLAAAPAGRRAYQDFGELVDLTVDLIHRVGDTAALVHDPDLDAYYLMDAAITRLPDVMVYAGRTADLVALVGGEDLAGEDAVQVAVARFGVSSDAERVSTGLATSVDNTARAQLGTNIAQALDSFLGAVDAFAPPTMLQELANTVDASVVADRAERVFDTATSLTHLLLRELQALLDARAGSLSQRNQILVIACVAAGLFGIALAFLVLVKGSNRPSPDADGSATRVGVGSLPRPERDQERIPARHGVDSAATRARDAR